jgi:hypothetical protein
MAHSDFSISAPALDAETQRWQARQGAQRKVREARHALVAATMTWTLVSPAPRAVQQACAAYEAALAALGAL